MTKKLTTAFLASGALALAACGEAKDPMSHYGDEIGPHVASLKEGHEKHAAAVHGESEMAKILALESDFHAGMGGHAGSLGSLVESMKTCRDEAQAAPDLATMHSTMDAMKAEMDDHKAVMNSLASTMAAHDEETRFQAEMAKHFDAMTAQNGEMMKTAAQFMCDPMPHGH